MRITTLNPATNEAITHYDGMSATKIETIIAAVAIAQREWARQPFAMRKKCMHYVADLLLERRQQYAILMAMEMGKPVTAGLAEVEKCARVCRYYADNAEIFLQPRVIDTEHEKAYVCYQPLGLIFAIMPWNFPMWQVFRFAIPNLMAGNGCLLKHAPISTGLALKIEQLFIDAGFLKDIFRTLIIDNEQAAMVIDDTRINGVTLTGSERAGKVVAAAAGRAITKSVLELGGSDPYIILPDAELISTAKNCVTSCMSNTGQVCIAAKRIITVGGVVNLP